MRRRLRGRFNLIDQTYDRIIKSLEEKDLVLNCIKKDNGLLLNRKK